jgi:hypothetical protein
VQSWYFGLLLAGLVVLAALVYAARTRRMPGELWLLALTGGALCTGAGFGLQARWEFRGTILDDLAPDEAACAVRFLVAAAYLDAIGVPPEAGARIRRGVTIAEHGGRARVDYALSGLGKSGTHAAVATWASYAPREACGMGLAARLYCARSQEDIARTLADAPAHIGRPSRVVLRLLLPEIGDRLPGARPTLTDFGRKIGAPAPR